MYHKFNSFEAAQKFIEDNENAKLACWGTLRTPRYMVFIPKMLG